MAAVRMSPARAGTRVGPWSATLRLLGRGGLRREVVIFGAIGVVSSATYALLYLAFRLALDPFVANALALLTTAIGNTAANRRLTFGVRSRRSMVRHQLAGLVALAFALSITTTSIGALDALVPHPGRLLELGVLIVANAIATLVRFLVLRTAIAGRPRRVARPAPAVPTQHWSPS